MSEYVRSATTTEMLQRAAAHEPMCTAPTRPRSTVARRLARRPDVLGCDCPDPWSHTCIERPERDRDAQTAALVHLAGYGLPALGLDIDVVRAGWKDHPEYRHIVVHCAAPQN